MAMCISNGTVTRMPEFFFCVCVCVYVDVCVCVCVCVCFPDSELKNTKVPHVLSTCMCFADREPLQRCQLPHHEPA